MINTHIYLNKTYHVAHMAQMPRRKASQARSKATVERILDGAASLIREKDPESVTMTEIARRANVVIGSVYQYFADKSAINRALLERHYAEVREMLEARLTNVETFNDFLGAMDAAAARYYELHQTDPFYNGIWSAVQTDAALQALDQKDTLQTATYLVSVSRKLLPNVDADELVATYALALQFAATTGRFARGLPAPLKRQALPIYRRIMRNCFDSLFAANSHASPSVRAEARRSRVRVRFS